MRDIKINKDKNSGLVARTNMINHISHRNSIRKQRVLGLFLLFVFCTFIAKVIESVMLDLGIGINGKIQLSWWNDPEIIASTDPRIQGMLAQRPHTFWIFTQFTWLTTIIIMIYLFLRYFKYDENVPPWLRWVLSPRSLTLLAAYDTVVAIIFWAGIAGSFLDKFSPFLMPFQVTLTVIVHAVIPVLIVAYAISVQISSPKASMLREGYIIRGMVYPTVYSLYYFMIAVTWHDPYPVTNIHDDIIGNLIWAPLALVSVYIILGIFMIIQNAVLLRFNTKYDLSKDYGVAEFKRIETMKAKDVARRKFARTYLHNEAEEKRKLEAKIKKEAEKKIAQTRTIKAKAKQDSKKKTKTIKKAPTKKVVKKK